jgi:hypothetical protein
MICVLLVGSAAQAGITVVKDILDHEDHVDWNGPWFVPPDTILDHSPFYRGMWEDWGWIHNLTDQVPSDALGIQSATLEVHAWDVDANYAGENEYEGPEVDIIYANGVRLGELEDSGRRRWKSTLFSLPPAILESLWLDGEVYIFMDIDSISDMSGHRVTLKYATLTVEYVVSGLGTPSRLTVHRFWSPILGSHFYTAREEEKEYLEEVYPDAWSYEGIAYRALPNGSEPNSAPVYRFWSGVLGGHFYTMDAKERDTLINEYSDVWTYEEIAWYAFPPDQQPVDTRPVHRFWSDSNGHHFYTISDLEKDTLLKEFPHVWTYEGIAWYAYE